MRVIVIATIKDVAKKAGVSVTAVSMVLNNTPNRIPEKTREAVVKAARELNYRPNQLAVSLITKKSHTIGLIIPDIGNLFFAGLTKAIQEAAWEKGYNLICGSSNNKAKRDYEYLQMFVDRQTDGIIMVRSTLQDDEAENDSEMAALLRSLSIPVILLDRSFPNADIPVIKLDNHKGGYLATKHLLEFGHRRIGCYTGPMTVSSSIERFAGYQAALDEYKIPFEPELLFEGNYQLDGKDRAWAFFREKNVSAIFCFNDIMAYGIYIEAQKQGVSIPQDLSIIGFDNNFLSSALQPGLTTMCQPIEQMGKIAVERLLHMIDKKPGIAIHQDVMLDPQLIERESVLAVRGNRK